ncbi:unnamed protein product [Chrysodeixis includens]|uniref:Peptide-N(4)-(N-acetyl-beta-glucosaminyl)asparagine amidase n=1 Tax=Chrysodeixis includens TaxID=689277 RepID=A0A9P0BS88_CHRIL|nr:unnamed protein product [Chrysodeixis includens]
MEDMARLAVVEQSLRDVDKFNKVLYELLRLINHILENPHDKSFRTINSDILKDELKCEAFNEYLKYVGFRPEGTELIYPKEQTLSNLRMAQAAIERKINFCYGPVHMQKSVRFRAVPKKVELRPAHILTTKNPLLSKIELMFNHVLMYEDEELQELAREKIPLVTLQLMALDRVREQQKLIKTGELKGPDLPFDIALLMELLGWFKHKFFTWVDQPSCDTCGDRTVFTQTVAVTLETETCRMEVYKCVSCGGGARFARYNDVRTLLRTRRGRCGEWANCFALLCRALGYDTRYVYDTSDHVWCEVFDYDSNTWLHADPCEAKLNAPLMYAHGWGKKLAYVIAVSRDDLQDVTWRYTMNHKEVLSRRTLCSEAELVSCILSLRAARQRQLSDARRAHLARRTLQELATLMVERKPTDYESHGRISGSLQWRSGRGEAGTQPQGYSFEFSKPGECSVRYHANTDKYKIIEAGVELEPVLTWSAGVYSAKNVFRKVEHDWRMVYLAREEDAALGVISWRVHAGRGLRLCGVRLRASLLLRGGARLAWALAYDTEPAQPAPFDNEQLQSGVSLPRSCRSLELRAQLSGGEGEMAWQHAQVCRQSLDAKPPALVITATLVPDS